MKLRSAIFRHGWILPCLLVCVSCSRSGEDISLPKADFLEQEQRIENVHTGVVCMVEEMQSDDIIVAVNGYPLRRSGFDRKVVGLTRALMHQKDASTYMVEEQVDVEKPRIVKEFVVKRLLLDYARVENILSDTEIRDKLRGRLNEIAKRGNVSPSKILTKIPNAERGDFLYGLCEQILIGELVKKRIPPKIAVTDEFVKEVQAQVEADNNAIRMTNEMLRAEMKKWKTSIMKGSVTFSDMARAQSKYQLSTNGNYGVWGDFEQSEMDDRHLARIVFKLQKGEISDPIEDDNGYSLVWVRDIKPAIRNEKGRVIQKEIRSLSRIYKEKEPEILRQDDSSMFKDLKQQMQMQAIYEFANVLLTNGNNKVIYPHGERLFR